MEQRRLRLGDILDDYCPRERRVTNHAVVAMIEEDVKQTRCTTCDAEHAYKGGREPRRRKASATSALYREVLADMPETAPVPATVTPPEDEVPVLVASSGLAADAEPAAGEPEEGERATDDDVAVAVEAREEGPVHRPLIRATLPRPEGQKDPRPIPEFTIRRTAVEADSSAATVRIDRAGTATALETGRTVVVSPAATSQQCQVAGLQAAGAVADFAEGRARVRASSATAGKKRSR